MKGLECSEDFPKYKPMGPDKLEVVASFCYMSDMLSAGGGCDITVTTRVKQPGRSSGSYYQFSHSSYKTRGHV